VLADLRDSVSDLVMRQASNNACHRFPANVRLYDRAVFCNERQTRQAQLLLNIVNLRRRFAAAKNDGDLLILKPFKPGCRRLPVVGMNIQQRSVQVGENQ